jgi:hypothetical protein
VAAGLLLALEHACPPLLKELDLYYDDNSVNQMVQTLEMVIKLNPTTAYFKNVKKLFWIYFPFQISQPK